MNILIGVIATMLISFWDLSRPNLNASILYFLRLFDSVNIRMNLEILQVLEVVEHIRIM